jgi:hypothetical protein
MKLKNYLLLGFSALTILSCSNDENLLTNDSVVKNVSKDVSARAGTVTGQYGQHFDSDYPWAFVSNNIWNWNNSGTDREQYIWYNSINNWGVKAYTTFGSNPKFSEVKSYGSLVFGNHYGAKSTNLNGFPIKIKNIRSALNTQWTVRTENTDNGSVWNASYDLWFDPSNTNEGLNAYELMVWTTYKNQNPIGNIVVNSVKIGAISFEVWEGNNGGNDVITFRAINGSGVYSGSLKPFIDYAVKTRKWISNENYLTSIQAGFEICTAGFGPADNQKANFVTDKFSLKI